MRDLHIKCFSPFNINQCLAPCVLHRKGAQNFFSSLSLWPQRRIKNMYRYRKHDYVLHTNTWNGYSWRWNKCTTCFCVQGRQSFSLPAITSWTTAESTEDGPALDYVLHSVCLGEKVTDSPLWTFQLSVRQ